jgi:hypothetical protein
MIIYDTFYEFIVVLKFCQIYRKTKNTFHSKSMKKRNRCLTPPRNRRNFLVSQ